MTTETAAAILDITPDSVGQLCRDGKLPGSKRVRRGKRHKGLRWEVSGKAVRRRRKALGR